MSKLTKMNTIAVAISATLSFASINVSAADYTSFSVSGAPSVLSGELGSFSALAPTQSLEKYLSANPAYGYTGAEKFRVTHKSTDAQGYIHTTYKQTLNGRNVYGTQITIHAKKAESTSGFTASAATEIYSVNGHLALAPGKTISPSVSSANSQSGSAAALAAAQEIGIVVSTPELSYVYVAFTGTTESAYRIEVQYVRSNGEPAHDVMFFSSEDNRVVARHAQMHSATAKTYDLQNQTVESAADEWKLPGQLLCTGNQNCNDNTAQQAHDGAQKVDQYYQEIFGRNSLDNAGMDLISSVHLGTNLNNAFWTGKQMLYGDGDGTQFNAFTSDFDIIGHEFTHGVTSKTANMNYENAPGALNEAWSDILGISAETWKNNSTQPNWNLGEGVKIDGSAFRYMSNPTQDNYSKDYWPERIPFVSNPSGGQNGNDYGGVHGNSGIANLAYVLLVDGGSHPRNKTNIQVTGIGLKKAEKIFYGALTSNHMGQTTSFAEARAATETVAEQLYGAAEKESVCKAWLAVGVDESRSCGTTVPPTGQLSETNLSGSGESFFEMNVPSGASNVKFTTSGGTGDVDLYVKFGSRPTDSSYDCRPFQNGNEETCDSSQLTQSGGVYHVRLVAYQAYTGVTLTGSFSGDTGGNEAPTANFTESCNELACSFDASSSTDSDGNITNYSWNFGDSSGTATGQSPSYTYSQDGSYTVELIVTDNEGATNTYSKLVTVSSETQGGNCNSAYVWELWTTYYPGDLVQYNGNLYRTDYQVYYWAPDSGYGYYTYLGSCN